MIELLKNKKGFKKMHSKRISEFALSLCLSLTSLLSVAVPTVHATDGLTAAATPSTAITLGLPIMMTAVIMMLCHKFRSNT